MKPPNSVTGLVAPRQFSLRAYIIAYGFSVAVPLVMLAGAFGYFWIDREHDRVLERLLDTSGALADDIDRDIERRLAVLRTLTTAPVFRERNWQEVHAYARAAVGDSAFVIVLDRSLEQLLNTLVPYGTPLPRTGDPDTAMRMLEEKKPDVSDYFVGRISRRAVFDINMPIIENGEVRFIVVLALSPDDLRPILVSQNLPDGWISTVVDRKDVVLARSRSHEQYLGKSVPESLTRRKLPGAGVYRAVTEEGENIWLAVAETRLAGWRVTIGLPTAVADGALRTTLLTWGFLIAAAVLLAVVIGLIGARLVAQPILAVRNLAIAFGHGKHSEPSPTRLAEANELATTLSQAQTELVARTAGLESARQIAEQRAAQLQQAQDSQRMLVQEVNHRVNNTLAVVQSLVRQTELSTREPGEFRRVLTDRRKALAAANNLLTRQDWKGGSLKEIADGALAPFMTSKSRVQIIGPAAFATTGLVVPLTLMLHELATNASMYGSLSVSEGTVVVQWKTTVRDADTRVELSWLERGGPAARPPERKGFGSRLVEASAVQWGGELRTDYADEGFSLCLTFDLPGDARN